MQKLIFFIALGILFCACAKVSPTPNQVQKPLSLVTENIIPTVADTLYGPLNYLTGFFSGLADDPNIGPEVSAFLGASPAIKKEMSYVLDSVRGLQIDFAGMTHGDYGGDESDVIESQAKVEKIIRSGKYDIIGYEASSKFGFVTKVDVEQDLNEEFIATIGKKLTPADVAEQIDINLSTDAILRYITSGGKNVIGTEPKELFRLQQKIIFGANAIEDEYYKNILDQSSRAMSSVRSVVALSRTAKMLKSTGGKRAVIVFGSAHGPDFIWFKNALGVNGNITVL